MVLLGRRAGVLPVRRARDGQGVDCRLAEANRTLASLEIRPRGGADDGALDRRDHGVVDRRVPRLALAAVVRRIDALRAGGGALPSASSRRTGPRWPVPEGRAARGAAAPVVEGERSRRRALSSSDLNGSTPLVAFADPTCQACEALVPALLAAAAAGECRHRGDRGGRGGVAAGMVPPVRSEDRVGVVPDDGGEVAAAFDTGFTPHVFVVDEGGVVTSQGSADTLRRGEDAGARVRRDQDRPPGGERCLAGRATRESGRSGRWRSAGAGSSRAPRPRRWPPSPRWLGRPSSRAPARGATRSRQRAARSTGRNRRHAACGASR